MKIIFMSKGFEKTSMDLASCDPEELIMLIDFERCISCGACEVACQLEHGEGPESPAVYRPVRFRTGEGDENAGTLYMPLACRHCKAPCDYYSQYNFWITCPSAKGCDESVPSCDLCAERLKQGLWPACATRCSMKTICFGYAKDIAFVLKDKRLRDLGEVRLGQHAIDC